MLKRTMILLGLTITIGALLLVVGCGGANNPVTSNESVTLESLLGVSENMPTLSRARGDAEVRLVTGNSASIEVKDNDVITSIGVVWLFPNGQWGRKYYFPNKTEFSFPLPYFGQADYAFTVGTKIGLDSWYSVTRDGQLIRRWP